MRDRDHLVEVCHDLINKALRCETGLEPEGGAEHREREAAIRRALAALDAAENVVDADGGRQRTALQSLTRHVHAYREAR